MLMMLCWTKASKCKKLLKQVRSRLQCLKNERSAISMQLREDLEKIDHEELNLRIQQEQHIRDESCAYDLLDYFCKFILKHLFYIRTHKRCRRRNLAEAVSSLVFASSRLTCGVIPELEEIRDLFGERYGESFVDTAVKLLPGNLVNPTFKKNMIALSPDSSVMPTDHEPVKPSSTGSSPDQAPARSSTALKEDIEADKNQLHLTTFRCPKHVHPKLPDWDDIYTEFSALKKSNNANPKLLGYDDIAAKMNALKIPKIDNTCYDNQLQLEYLQDHESVDDAPYGCRNLRSSSTVVNTVFQWISSLVV